MDPSKTTSRMIGYARVSTDEQAISGLGLADQELRIREMAKPRGWRLVQMIRDEGLSAGTLERPGLHRALGLLAAGRADGLVVAKLDRLTRSTIDFGLLIEWFKDSGRVLVLLDLGVDTSTAAGELVANVIASVAQWERGVISERTRAALAALRAQGRPTGRPAVADDPQLLERIRRMHRSDGMTLRRIAEVLNAEGVPTLRGAAQWRVSSVQAACGYKRPPKRRKPVDLPAATRR
jgi:DNA invertase Pin-like site-specific DNA recombinase